MPRLLPLVALSLALACEKSSPDTTAPEPGPAPVQDAALGLPSDDPATTTAPDPTERLATVVAGEHRSADNKARDAHRHPVETLAFFGVRPEHRVIELWPGGGWYTEILAPYVAGQGSLVVTIFDPAGPEGYYGTRQAKEMLAAIQAPGSIFAEVETVQIPQKVTLDGDGKVSATELQPFELGPAGSADVVLTFRNSHGWVNRGAAELVYGAAFRVLKPGGVFGVEQHRAAEGSDPKVTAKTGYLSEAAVIAAAEAVGFRLDGRSEINANPKDTRDHADGVWALPPTLAGGDKDRDKFVAIGESDRMTLRFVKPAS